MLPRSAELPQSPDKTPPMSMADCIPTAEERAFETRYLKSNALIQLERIKLIGTGAFSFVYLGKYTHLDVTYEVAIKDIKVCKYNNENMNLMYFRAEKECFDDLAKMQPHPNVIKYYDYVVNESTYSLILEYLPRGSLGHYIEKSLDPFRPLSWSICFTILQEVTDAIVFLHTVAGWLHNDIKSENVFLTHDFHVKLGDFGFACKISSKKIIDWGTPDFMAPERDQADSHPTPESDIFSLGVLFWEVKEWEIPTFSASTVRKKICNGEREKMQPDPPKLFALIQNMWKQNPKDRFTSREVAKELNNPEFKKELIAQPLRKRL